MRTFRHALSLVMVTLLELLSLTSVSALEIEITPKAEERISHTLSRQLRPFTCLNRQRRPPLSGQILRRDDKYFFRSDSTALLSTQRDTPKIRALRSKTKARDRLCAKQRQLNSFASTRTTFSAQPKTPLIYGLANPTYLGGNEKVAAFELQGLNLAPDTVLYLVESQKQLIDPPVQVPALEYRNTAIMIAIPADTDFKTTVVAVRRGRRVLISNSFKVVLNIPSTSTQPSPTITPTPVASVTPTPPSSSPTSTPSASAIPTTTPTSTPSSTPTPTPTPQSSATSTPSTTATPSATPTVTASATPTPTATPSPTVSATPTPNTTGWTTLTPSADSRMVYVSSSSGNDNNNGLSASLPKRTIAAGKALIRHGFPDWLMLRSGDVFNESIGTWLTGGRSVAEPTVLTSYGTGPRPQVRSGGQNGIDVSGLAPGGLQKNYIAITNIHFRGRDGAPFGGSVGYFSLTPVAGLLIEGCVFERYQNGIVIQGFDGRHQNPRLRRNIIIDNYSTSEAHAGGGYFSGIDGLLLEENIFDHNGHISGVPEATGPTMFRHNIYIQTDCTNSTIRRNHIHRAAANGLSERSWGTVEDNTLVGNSIALLAGDMSGNGGVINIRRNVISKSKDIDGNNPRGWGIDTKGATSGELSNNLVFNSVGNFPVGILIDAGTSFPVRNFTVEGNKVFNWRGQQMRINGTNATLTNFRIRNNHFQEPATASDPLIVHADASSVTSIAESLNNRFFRAGTATWFALGGSGLTLSQYRTQVSDTTSIAQQVYYLDPNRSLGSYFGTIGGTATDEAFFAALRQQSRANWNPQLETTAVNAYLQAGFAIQP